MHVFNISVCNSATGGKSADAIDEVNDALDQSSGSEDSSMDSGSDGSSSEDDQAAPGNASILLQSSHICVR